MRLEPRWAPFEGHVAQQCGPEAQGLGGALRISAARGLFAQQERLRQRELLRQGLAAIRARQRPEQRPQRETIQDQRMADEHQVGRLAALDQREEIGCAAIEAKAAVQHILDQHERRGLAVDLKLVELAKRLVREQDSRAPVDLLDAIGKRRAARDDLTHRAR